MRRFSDAKWISDSDETKSTSGYVFTLVGGAISGNLLNKLLFHVLPWKQAEIIALDTATSEAEFLKNLLCDFPLLNKPIPQMISK